VDIPQSDNINISPRLHSHGSGFTGNKLTEKHSHLACEDSLRANISDISNLSRKALCSSPDLRPEVLSKAQELLDDPDWLSDRSLDTLAGKLLDQESL
jgi:hypothetical protein